MSVDVTRLDCGPCEAYEGFHLGTERLLRPLAGLKAATAGETKALFLDRDDFGSGDVRCCTAAGRQKETPARD